MFKNDALLNNLNLCLKASSKKTMTLAILKKRTADSTQLFRDHYCTPRSKAGVLLRKLAVPIFTSLSAAWNYRILTLAPYFTPIPTLP